MTPTGPERRLRLPAQPDLPPHWWGPMGRGPVPLSLPDLIANRTLSIDLAAWLWLLIEAGASTLVCAGPGGAGKTTLLTAITPFIAPSRTPYVVRGAYDPLEAIAGRPASNTALLVNEISAHLPIYVWGPAARRVFDAGQAGAQVLATAHATSVEDIIRELSAPPISAGADDLRLWDLILFIEAWWQDDHVERRVRDAVSLSLNARLTFQSDDAAQPDEVEMQRLARRLWLMGGTIAQEVERRKTALGLAP